MKALHQYIAVCLLISLGLIGGTATAQNVHQDFARINQFYAELEGGSFQLEYRLYLDGEPQPLETFVGETQWLGKQSYLQLQGMEKIQTGQHALLVNHEMETIIIQNARTEPALQSPIALDSVLAICDSVQFQALADGNHAYTLDLGDMIYRSIQIVFNPQSYQLQRLVLVEAEPSEVNEAGEPVYARTEIHYQNFRSTQGKRLASTYRPEKFVQIKGDQIELQPAYQHYQLLNFTR